MSSSVIPNGKGIARNLRFGFTTAMPPPLRLLCPFRVTVMPRLVTAMPPAYDRCAPTLRL